MPILRNSVLLVTLFLALGLAACGPSPEEVAQTVSQTVEARPPEVIEEQVEVTRIVEVEIESEVTRIVEVEATVEVPIEVEVTRVVEIEITSTPEPTPTATATAVPQPTAVPQTNNGGTSGNVAASGNVADDVLATLEYMKSRMDQYRAQLNGNSIDCLMIVEIANEFTTPRQFNLTNATPETQNEYANYVAAIDRFQNSGTRDLNEHCRNLLADPANTPTHVSNHKMGVIMSGIEEVIGMLRNIISALGGDVGG